MLALAAPGKFGRRNRPGVRATAAKPIATATKATMAPKSKPMTGVLPGRRMKGRRLAEYPHECGLSSRGFRLTLMAACRRKVALAPTFGSFTGREANDTTSDVLTARGGFLHGGPAGDPPRRRGHAAPAGAATLLAPRHPSRVKQGVFECGSDPVGSARERFGVKFYMVALLFIVFDVEAVFVYPWAVLLKALGWSGYIAMAFFAFT